MARCRYKPQADGKRYDETADKLLQKAANPPATPQDPKIIAAQIWRRRRFSRDRIRSRSNRERGRKRSLKQQEAQATMGLREAQAQADNQLEVSKAQTDAE